MTQNNGTLVIATIRPNDSLDKFAVALSNEIKGGLHSYSTFADIENIPILRRQIGMIVNVTNDLDNQLNSSFVLNNDLTTWRYLNQRYILCTQLENLTNNYVWNTLPFSTYRFVIDKIYIKTSTGSAVCTFLIGNTAIGDLTTLNANSVISTFISSDPTNYISEGQNLKLLVNSVSLDLNSLVVQVELLRVLPKPILPSLSVCGLQNAFVNSHCNPGLN